MIDILQTKRYTVHASKEGRVLSSLLQLHTLAGEIKKGLLEVSRTDRTATVVSTPFTRRGEEGACSVSGRKQGLNFTIYCGEPFLFIFGLQIRFPYGSRGHPLFSLQVREGGVVRYDLVTS